MAVTKRLRFEILRRDGHACRYCGRAAPDVRLTIDHVRPEALGGTDEPENLVTACIDCNAGKSSVPADAMQVAAVAESAVRWAAAIKRVADMRMLDTTRYDNDIAQFVAQWDTYTYEAEKVVLERRTVPKDDSWELDVRRFLALGLPTQKMLDFIVVAMKKDLRHADTWRYFCGCCWKEITEMQKAAAALLAEEEPLSSGTEPDRVQEPHE